MTCNGGKPNLVLDLDNTLICSLTFKELEKLRKPPTNLQYVDMDKQYRIYIRPHLHEFLDYAFKHFDVTIWTAASKDYAMFIIEHILMKPQLQTDYIKTNRSFRNFKMILHSHNCDQSSSYYSVDSPKDLRYLYHFDGYFKCNTVIIDDLDDVFKANPQQTIKAPYFEAKHANAHEDKFLLDVFSTLDKLRRHNH